MIPKSVSGSTRIVALTAILLIPVWGLAGESPNCTSDNIGACRIPIDPDPMVCDEDMNCFRFSCAQRMREAMQTLNRVEELTTESAALRTGLFVKMVKEDRKHWEETMKDCVEGK